MSKITKKETTGTMNAARYQAVERHGEPAVILLENNFEELKNFLAECNGSNKAPIDNKPFSIDTWPLIPLPHMDGAPASRPVQVLGQGVAIKEDVFEVISAHETMVNFTDKTQKWCDYSNTFSLGNMVVKVKFWGENKYHSYYLRGDDCRYAVVLASNGSQQEKSPQAILVVKLKGKTVIWEFEEFYMLSEAVVKNEEYRCNFIAFSKTHKILWVDRVKVDRGLFDDYDDDDENADPSNGKDTKDDVNQ